ncbi:hypothetical protein D910_12676 [Dendroctonus ponderosae]|uniref:Factor VIII intron 22 protein n=1 Tax=Dendroctonus ponderosae TaxID=77166 RepID=U4UQN4_DENPD|nr:hypothetical protein D910_12676 [Dendroctonus ponderosae]
MSSEATGYTILDRYRSIASKLKKRFLRKPNEAEAAEGFISLGHHCESEELPQYAAMSWLAAARCEGSLSHPVSETSLLVRAGRQFLKAGNDDLDIGCISVSSESLQVLIECLIYRVLAGLACHNHASSRYPEDSLLALGLNLEIIEYLKRIECTESLEVYLNNALELSKGTAEAHLHCLDLLASYYISTGECVSGVHTYQKIASILQNSYLNGHTCELLLKCEVNSVFLLLILRPSPHNISADFAKILEKYTWGDQNDETLQACRMTERLFILLQSLVTSCQSRSTTNLVEIEADFWPYLSTEQKDLLRILVKTYYY